MIEVFLSGGPIMFLLLFLSLVAATIIVERILYFNKNRVNEEQLLGRLKSALEKGHYDEALAICESNPSPITNLMKVGITYRDQPIEVIKDLVMDAASMEVPSMERFLSALGTISTIAPLLGLLGTVQGNIEAFNVLNTATTEVADPALLAGGIATALITTAAGIIVAVPAVIFYNYLVTKANHSIIRLENRVNELVMFLGESRKKD